MKQTLQILSVILLLYSCSNKNLINNYLPHQMEKSVYFGQSLEEFKENKGDKINYYDGGQSFRVIYVEDVKDNEVSYFTYYFDQDDDKPLYEIIIGYKSEQIVQTEAINILGEPNYKEIEWKIEREGTYDLLAWVFKEKLIVTALIPKTEWYDDFHSKDDKNE